MLKNNLREFSEKELLAMNEFIADVLDGIADETLAERVRKDAFRMLVRGEFAEA